MPRWMLLRTISMGSLFLALSSCALGPTKADISGNDRIGVFVGFDNSINLQRVGLMRLNEKKLVVDITSWKIPEHVYAAAQSSFSRAGYSVTRFGEFDPKQTLVENDFVKGRLLDTKYQTAIASGIPGAPYESFLPAKPPKLSANSIQV